MSWGWIFCCRRGRPCWKLIKSDKRCHLFSRRSFFYSSDKRDSHAYIESMNKQYGSIAIQFASVAHQNSGSLTILRHSPLFSIRSFFFFALKMKAKKTAKIFSLPHDCIFLPNASRWKRHFANKCCQADAMGQQHRPCERRDGKFVDRQNASRHQIENGRALIAAVHRKQRKREMKDEEEREKFVRKTCIRAVLCGMVD